MFDIYKAIQTRDGRAVIIWGVQDGLIAGAIPDGRGSFTAHLWGEQSGLCADEIGSSDHPDDLVNAPVVYQDAYLEYWGDIFIARGLQDLGILFETFLGYPNEILRALDGRGDFAPLLPKQRQVFCTLLNEDAIGYEAGMLPPDARLRDCGYTQPMKHHSYASSNKRCMRS